MNVKIMQNPQKIIVYDPYNGNMLTTHMDDVRNWTVKTDQSNDNLCDNISIMNHDRDYDFTDTKLVGSLSLSKGILAISDSSVEYSHSTCKFVPVVEGELSFESTISSAPDTIIYVWISYIQELPIEMLISSSPLAVRRRLLIKKLHNIDDDTLIKIEKATDTIIRIDPSFISTNITSIDLFDS